MSKSFCLLISSFLLISNLFSQDRYTVTYIANDGFLVESGDKKVLIDGVFSPINEDWCESPSEAMEDSMLVSGLPFNDIDILAITHKHRDHFDANTVTLFMMSNGKCELLCPDQVLELLAQEEFYPAIKDRIHSITPLTNQDSILSMSGITVKVLRLEHSHYIEEDTVTGKRTNRHANIENLGYVISMPGVRLFHCGDANPRNIEEYKGFGLNKDSIEIAFLDRLFFFADSTGIDIMENYISAKIIVLMHLSPANKPNFISHFAEHEHIYVFEEKLTKIGFTKF